MWNRPVVVTTVQVTVRSNGAVVLAVCFLAQHQGFQLLKVAQKPQMLGIFMVRNNTLTQAGNSVHRRVYRLNRTIGICQRVCSKVLKNSGGTFSFRTASQVSGAWTQVEEDTISRKLPGWEDSPRY